MTIIEAAIKWKISPNWVRELIKSGRVPAKLMRTGPVPFYEIPDKTPKPPSMRRFPARKGSTKAIKPESLVRRQYRDAERKEAAKKVKAAPKK